MKKSIVNLATVIVAVVATNAALGLDIQFNAGPMLTANAPALATFNRAADRWEALFADNITVHFDADLAELKDKVIGGATPMRDPFPFNTARMALVTDAADETDDGVVANLATMTSSQFTVPAGSTLSGNVFINRATQRALGLLPNSNTGPDATLNFSTLYTYDYDNTNGITPGAIDFESVVTHEIGHALGFISRADSMGANATPSLLDFFRFANTANPTNAAEFSSLNRILQPGVEAVFDDLVNEWSFSTGMTGDGQQASHWKDNSISGTILGIMDPTKNSGQPVQISRADIRAFDLIGYEYVVPTTFHANNATINTAVAGLVDVGRNGTGGNTSPTVQLDTGGSVSGEVSVFNSSHFVLKSTGSIGKNLHLFNGSVADIEGGSVGDRVTARGTARVNLKGGTVGGSFTLEQSSQALVDGGTIAGTLDADGSTIVDIKAGTINGNVEARGSSKVNIRGGTIKGSVIGSVTRKAAPILPASLAASDVTAFETVALGLAPEDGPIFDWSGGTLTDILFLGVDPDDSEHLDDDEEENELGMVALGQVEPTGPQLIVHGYNLFYETESSNYTKPELYGARVFDLNFLSGTLLDGTPLRFVPMLMEHGINAGITIVNVPEPCSLALAGICLLMGARRKRF